MNVLDRLSVGVVVSMVARGHLFNRERAIIEPLGCARLLVYGRVRLPVYRVAIQSVATGPREVVGPWGSDPVFGYRAGARQVAVQ